MKAYLGLREQLKPYLYALSRQTQDGLPLVRPLLMSFPHEQVGYGRDFADEFMLGDQLLVAPIVNGKADNRGLSVRDRIYLPDTHGTTYGRDHGKTTIGILALDPAAQTNLERGMLDLLARFDRGGGSGLVVPSEYLEAVVRPRRAS